jgi:hypothetical protein
MTKFKMAKNDRTTPMSQVQVLNQLLYNEYITKSRKMFCWSKVDYEKVSYIPVTTVYAKRGRPSEHIFIGKINSMI